MTNLASGDGEGDVEIAVHFLLGFLNRHLVGPLLELRILHADRGALRLHLGDGPVHVDIVLGIHGIRCGKRVLDLALGSGVQLLGLLTECLSQILDPFVQSVSTSTFLVEVNPASEALILQ